MLGLYANFSDVAGLYWLIPNATFENSHQWVVARVMHQVHVIFLSEYDTKNYHHSADRKVIADAAEEAGVSTRHEVISLYAEIAEMTILLRDFERQLADLELHEDVGAGDFPNMQLF